MEVFETPLPGIGVRHEFMTSDGERLGVVTRRDSRRELLLYDRDDPDSCRLTIELTPEEAATMVELLGGSRVIETLQDLRHEVEGLSIQWVTIPAGQRMAGRTIADGEIRTRTGASVVAVIRGDQSVPGPGPDFQFEQGDVVLLMGSEPSVEAAERLLTE
jgi:K+:H+ antiporter subunit KhtT